MDHISLALRLVLAAVFLFAGLAKLRDRPGTSVALRAFRLPERLVGAGAVLLPALEVSLGVGLLGAGSARWASLVSVVTVLGFTSAIVLALRRGDAPRCHCFGQTSDDPVGSRTISRNLLLAAGASVVAVSPGPTLFSIVDDFPARGDAALVIAAAVYGLALWRLETYRQPRRIGRRLPRFEAVDVSGRAVNETSFNGGNESVIAFVADGCLPCHELIRKVAAWHATLSPQLSVRIVGSGSAERLSALALEHNLPDLIADPTGRLFDRLGLQATPTAILIDADGRVASTPAPGVIEIEQLIRQALRRAC